MCWKTIRKSGTDKKCVANNQKNLGKHMTENLTFIGQSDGQYQRITEVCNLQVRTNRHREGVRLG